MRNRLKKILSLTLALVMALSCLALTAGAATKETVRQYGKEGG